MSVVFLSSAPVLLLLFSGQPTSTQLQLPRESFSCLTVWTCCKWASVNYKLSAVFRIFHCTNMFKITTFFVLHVCLVLPQRLKQGFAVTSWRTPGWEPTSRHKLEIVKAVVRCGKIHETTKGLWELNRGARGISWSEMNAKRKNRPVGWDEMKQTGMRTYHMRWDEIGQTKTKWDEMKPRAQVGWDAIYLNNM